MNTIRFLAKPAPRTSRREEGARRVMDFQIDGVSLEGLARAALPGAFEPRKCFSRPRSKAGRIASLCGASDGFVLLGGEHFLTGGYREFCEEDQMRLPLLVCDSCLRMWCDGSLWTRLRREKGLVWWEGLEGADRAVLHPMSFKFDAADYDVAFAGAREKALGRAVRRYRPAVGIPPACQKLFQYASSFVTPTLIHDHCMNDPGFADYVREYLLVLRAGPPARPCFDFWETLSDFVYRENDYPDAGQRFACFLFSAALASSSCARSEGNDRGYHAERITGNLLAYALALGDRKMLEMLSPAFLESYAGLGGTGEMDDIRDLDFCIKEVPYLTLARLALAHMGCAPQENKSALLEQLMQEAREHEWDKPTEHRWERPTWAKLPGWWRDLIEKTYPENARPLPDLSWQAGQA